MPKKVYLIDGNSFIYRMFFALPEFTTKTGKPVNALFGMAKFFTGQLIKENPEYLIFIKDAKGENFRHALYAEYKATRDRMPDNLRAQIADIETMIQKMGIQIIEIPWYEADDVIATLAEKLKKDCNFEVYILSGDKDLYALIDEQVKVYDTQKKKISWREETIEKFWVPPECVRDYLAICGDSSDNIPWISGIWPKKAQVLLSEFWSLEKIYEVIENISEIFETISQESQKILKGKTLEKFIESKEIAFLSQKLATLDENVVLENFSLGNFEFQKTNILNSQAIDFFNENEFYSLIQETSLQQTTWKDLKKNVKIIGEDQELENLKQKIFSGKYSQIVLDTETTSLDTQKANLVWVSLLLDENHIYYVNRLHAGPKVSDENLKIFLKKIFESNLLIIGHNLKYDLQILENFLISDVYKKETNKPQMILNF